VTASEAEALRPLDRSAWGPEIKVTVEREAS
jgi:hypothetical protein